MAVAFEELEGSPRLRVSQDGITAERVFRVAWSNWPAFARELIGSYRLVGEEFTFVAPLEFPGFPNLIVSDLDVVPFDPGGPDGDGLSSLTSATNAYTSGGAQVTAT